MLHIWTPERYAAASADSDNLASVNLASDAPSVEDLRRNHALDELEEYEFVLGRRQVASWSFVMLVVISVFAGIAYLAGRSTVAHANASAPPSIPAIQPAAALPTPPPAAVVPPVVGTPAAPVPAPKLEANAGTDVFANPVGGAMYIQMAAVDRGIATIMAEGLRTHGLPAIVAPGPNEKIFRVLVGPFPNAAALQQTKESLAQIGLSSFAQFQK